MLVLRMGQREKIKINIHTHTQTRASSRRARRDVASGLKRADETTRNDHVGMRKIRADRYDVRAGTYSRRSFPEYRRLANELRPNPPMGPEVQ